MTSTFQSLDIGITGLQILPSEGGPGLARVTTHLKIAKITPIAEVFFTVQGPKSTEKNALRGKVFSVLYIQWYKHQMLKTRDKNK